MARVVYSQRSFADLERLIDFLQDDNPIEAAKTMSLITQAVGFLENHPLIGCPAEQGIKELVISREKSGYLALYSYEPMEDVVLVLALQYQREAGYFQD